MKKLFANRQYKNPGIIPWVFIILSTSVLLTLGSWQVQRLAWKEGLLNRLEAGQQLVPLVQLPTDTKALDDALYRRVKLTGELERNVYFLRVGMHRLDGKGFSILTPFNYADESYVLVNRGFIAGEKEEIEAALKEETATGPTIIEGILRPARKARLFTPSNHPDKNIWLTEDIAAMEKILNVDTGGEVSTPSEPSARAASEPPHGRAAGETGGSIKLQKNVIDMTAETPMKGTTVPVPKDVKITFRNDHLTYAVTWFGLALTGVIMFYFFCTRRKEES